jgi:hypothetical protein
MEIKELKKILSKIPTVYLSDIVECWIEVVLERNLGSRVLTYNQLGISKTKLAAFMNNGRVKDPRGDIDVF